MPAARFDAHWLAEAIRVREEREGRLDDGAALAALSTATADFETRALARARILSERLGWPERLGEWHRNARFSLLALLALAITSGAGLALAVLGDPLRPVNLIWALAGLLGMHGLSLLLWLLGMFAAGAKPGGALGRLWLAMTRRIPTAKDAPELPAALTRLLPRNGLGRWLFATVSHGLWLMLLLSALLTLLTLFSLRRYGFVWETTLLDARALSFVVDVLGLVPALFGITAPAPDSLLGAVQPDALRREWAQWLVACVLLYGVLPRAGLWLWCRARWRAACRSLRIDLTLPDNLLLREHLMPDHASLGVSDPAPETLAEAHAPTVRIDAEAGSALLGIELGDDLDWPPPLDRPLKLLERIETRQERRAVLERLAADPPERLVIACDTRLSPDRGSFALIAELARHAGEFTVWLAQPAGGATGPRHAYWLEGLAAMGIEGQKVIRDADGARLWLEARRD